MSRPIALTDQNSTQWVNSVQYGPANELTQIALTGIAIETRQYNSRLQLTNISMNGSPGMNLQYTYSPTQNNGRITSQKDFVNGEEVAYTYDSLNRLISAVTTAASDQVTTPWGQGFNYDGFGNLTAKTVLKGSVPTLSVAIDPTTNRLAGNYNYDPNGNLLSAPIGGGLYYDAENRLIQAQINYVGTFYYDYDPNNKRIVTNPGQTNEVFYFYGIDGKPMASAATRILEPRNL